MSMKPEGIRPLEQAVPSTRPEPVAGQGPGGGSPFAEMVQAPSTGATGVKTPAATEIAQQGLPGQAPTQESLAAQAASTQQQLTSLGSQLQNPQLKMSKADQKLLLKKLPRANDAVRAAAKQVGVDVGPKLAVPKTGSLLQKSLLFISDGEAKLNAVNQQIKRMDPSSINPSDMLLIQTKLTAASQEVSFLSNMLGSLVSGVKTLMNIQV